MQRNLGSEQANGPFTASAIAAAQGRVLVSWLDQTDFVARVTALPLAQPALVTYGAGTQVLLGTTSSSDSTLVVWRERVDGRLTLRAGVRDHDGHWVEREITDELVPESVIVQSDGHGFVLISPHRIWGLDHRGRVDWTKALHPLRVSDAVWNGREYVVTTFEDDVLATRTLSTSGVFGNPTPVVSHREAAGANLAFDGSGYLVGWTERIECPILCIPYGTVRATRLDANRQPIGDVNFGDAVASELQVIWDGRHYLVAWGGGKLEGARVSASGIGAPEPFSISGNLPASQLHMERVTGGAALVWVEHVSPPSTLLSRRIAFLPYGSDTPIRFMRDPGMALSGELRVEPLPNGGFAFLQSIVQPDAPHHGSTRVMMTAIAPVLPQLPDAPRINAAADFGRLRVEWTAPAAAVHGYRLEYRIGDGSWNEVDQWFDENDRGIILPWSLRAGVPYYFRVRALNDAGTSSYSNIAGANLPRRRAVR